MGRPIAPLATIASAVFIIGSSSAMAKMDGFSRSSPSSFTAGGSSSERGNSVYNKIRGALLPGNSRVQAMASTGAATEAAEPTTAKNECSEATDNGGEPIEGDDAEKQPKQLSGPEPIYFGF